VNVIRHIDPDRRMFRFHALTIHPDLLAGWSLLREWGRIGSPGRVRIEPHADEAQARDAAARFEARKRRKGYQ
jgi:predicted DNA-binding WGR domain protein